MDRKSLADQESVAMPRRQPSRRRRGIRVWKLMALVAVLGPALFCASCVGLFDPDLSDAAIHAMGDRLVADIEAWRKENGRYPYSLVEAGLGSPIWLHGGFRYVSRGNAFNLFLDGCGHDTHTFYSAGWFEGWSHLGWSCYE